MRAGESDSKIKPHELRLVTVCLSPNRNITVVVPSRVLRVRERIASVKRSAAFNKLQVGLCRTTLAMSILQTRFQTEK